VYHSDPRKANKVQGGKGDSMQRAVFAKLGWQAALPPLLFFQAAAHAPALPAYFAAWGYGVHN
jgi:hypothetical protein